MGGGTMPYTKLFAQGMLMNVLAAMNALELDAPWAKALCKKDD